jgi:hypothetical protein
MGTEPLMEQLGSEVYAEGWIVLQEGNYRFRVLQEGGLTVQMAFVSI